MAQTIGWGLATAMLTLLFGVASPAVVNVVGGGEAEVIDLSELADGETRIFGSGEHTITATRNGDSIALQLPAGEGDRAKTIDCKLGGSGGCYAFTTDDSAGIKMLVVDDGDGDEVRHTVSVLRIGEGDGNVFTQRESNVFVLEGVGGGAEGFEAMIAPDGPHAGTFAVGGGKRVLRCPEGDTTMRLEKDDDGIYRCPRHNVELDEVEIEPLIKRWVVRSDGDDVQ